MADLDVLRRAGTETLAYLSLGEDPVPGRPWQRPEVNRLWNVHYVDVGHPAWHAYVLDRAAAALEQGFDGFFLDTLDTPDLFPENAEPLVALVASLRALTDGYVAANRGFAQMERLRAHVDAFVFEGFSTTWQGGYRPLPRERLALNVELAHDLQATRRDLFALDYAITPELKEFAVNRAVAHGLEPQVSNKMLTRI